MHTFLNTHTSFAAETHGDLGSGSIEVIPVVAPNGDVLMTICTEHYPIYITKAQVMAFFNLVDAPAT